MAFQPVAKHSPGRHPDRNFDYEVHRIDVIHRQREHWGTIVYCPVRRQWMLSHDLAKKLKLRDFSWDEIHQAKFPYRDAKALVRHTSMNPGPWTINHPLEKGKSMLENLARSLRIDELLK